MDRLAKAKLIQSVYGKEMSPYAALQRLSQSSSSIAYALRICDQVMTNPKAKEAIAQAFVGCYAAGMVVGIEAEAEA